MRQASIRDQFCDGFSRFRQNDLVAFEDAFNQGRKFRFALRDVARHEMIIPRLVWSVETAPLKAPERPDSYCPLAAYAASIADLTGSHHAWLLRYHSIVAAKPSRKFVYRGVQPSSVRIFAESLEYRRS